MLASFVKNKTKKAAGHLVVSLIYETRKYPSMDSKRTLLLWSAA